MTDIDAVRQIARQQMEQDRLAGLPGQPLASVEAPEQRPLSEKGRSLIVAMTFKSSSEDVPHVVALGPDGVVRCTCKAMLNIEYRPAGCWAMVDFRRVAGIHEP